MNFKEYIKKEWIMVKDLPISKANWANFVNGRVRPTKNTLEKLQKWLNLDDKTFKNLYINTIKL